jgi:hypothetical protein
LVDEQRGQERIVATLRDRLMPTLTSQNRPGWSGDHPRACPGWLGHDPVFSGGIRTAGCCWISLFDFFGTQQHVADGQQRAAADWAGHEHVLVDLGGPSRLDRCHSPGWPSGPAPQWRWSSRVDWSPSARSSWRSCSRPAAILAGHRAAPTSHPIGPARQSPAGCV